MKTSRICSNEPKGWRNFLPDSRLTACVCRAIGLLIAGFIFAPCAQGAGRQVFHGHVRTEWARLIPTGRLPATNHLQLAIGLPLRNKEALTNLLREIYDPASPNYHHYLTPAQFTERFGPTKEDYQAMMEFAKASGLKVTATHPNRMIVDVEAPVANIEKTMHIRMHTYRHPKENRSFYAPNAEPTLDLATPVLHISGLDNYSLPRPLIKTAPLAKTHGAVPNAGSGTYGNYMGNDFRAAYASGTTLTGAGQYVGLVQIDSGFYQRDITNYEKQAGLTNIPIIPILLDGYTGGPGIANDEVSMDIEMAISMAPGLAGVLVYEGSGFDSIFNRMATDNLAKQLSCSWSEVIGGDDTTVDQIFQQMAAQGQSFFQASGDSGGYIGDISTPGANPFITSVGGTTLTTSGPGGNWVSEKAWNWGNAISGGGGISGNFSIPSWQTNINMTANQGSTTMRNVPDVALTADQIWVFYNNGSTNAFGGTSAAAPLWAGFCALINQQAVASGKPTTGFLNPTLYNIGSLESIQSSYFNAFHDIITGNNGLFQAVQGYDLCTGWGTPNGTNLINAILNPEPLVITPSATVYSIGGVGGPFTPVSQNFSLTNAGTTSLNWKLIKLNSVSWLSLSPTNGILAPGGATNVTATLNSAANGLGLGFYYTELEFINLNNNDGLYIAFTLNVVGPPAITTQPINQTLLDGMTATFTVGATASTPLAYQWRFNGNNLTVGGNIYSSTSSTLIISNASPANVGSYNVIVSNAAASVTSTSATLTIAPSAPVITLQPTNQVVAGNDNVQFTVAAVGTKPFSYQWRLNGTNLTGATNASLILNNVQTNQSGTYALLITGPNGSTLSSNAVLTVEPYTVLNAGNYTNFVFRSGTTYYIADQANLYGTTILEGGTVIKFGNYPIYLWDDSTTTNPIVCVPGNYTPSVLTALDDNSIGATIIGSTGSPTNAGYGGYNAYINDAYNNNDLSLTNVSFAYAAQAISFPGNNVYLTDCQFVQCGYGVYGDINGSVYCLNVLAVQCGALGTYSGFLYGVNLTMDGCTVLSQSSSGRLTNSIVTSCGGTSGFTFVKCLVTNNSANVFQTGPAQAGCNGNYYLPANSPLINAGTTNANLLGLYHYTTRTNQMPETNSIVDLGFHYVATDANANPLDSNGDGIPDYVEDANGNGVDDPGETPWNIAISLQPQSQSAYVADHAAFSVSAVGAAPLSYRWRFNGANLAGATGATLTFNPVKPENAGYYSVVVSNAGGSVTSIVVSLTVNLRPYTVLFDSQTNYTFKGDTTYYVAGWVNLYGTTIFEGGTVVKYPEYGGPLNLNGPFTCLTAPYRPAVFTSMNDDSVGQTIAGSSGSPALVEQGFLWDNYYSLTNSPLKHMRFSYGGSVNGNGAVYEDYFQAQDVQFVNCGWAIDCAGGSADTNITDVWLDNVLFDNCGICVAPDGQGQCVICGEHVTVDNCYAHFSSDLSPGNPDYDNGHVYLTNSIFANTANYNALMYGDHNGFYNSTPFGANPVTNSFYPFQTMVAGNYYLATNSPYRQAGTTNINPAVLAELRQKTTWPPVVCANLIFSGTTNFSPQARRDTNAAPDLGYHYDPIDYLFLNWGVVASGVQTFTPGTVVGGAISVLDSGILTFQGTATQPCWFVGYDTVQEEGNAPNWPSGISFLFDSPLNTVNASFTRFSALAADNHIGNGTDAGGSGVADMVNCEFFNAQMNLGQAAFSFINCLFSRVDVNVNDTYQDGCVFQNCLVWNGKLSLSRVWPGQSIWIITDSAFDGPAFQINDPFSGDTNYTQLDYNAFLTNADWTGGGHDVLVTNFNWQRSWLGGFYLPANSPLIDRGNTNADLLGLYHFTTQTSQVKETNSIVDIGYHYVAVDANGKPVDTDDDSVSDYVEDANGNGVVDTGETPR